MIVASFATPTAVPGVDEHIDCGWPLATLIQDSSVSCPWCILSISPPLFNQRVIDIGAIEQEHIGKGMRVLIEPASLECDVISINQIRSSLMRE